MADTAADILNAMRASARRRGGPRPGFLSSLSNPGAFYRARRTGALGRLDFEALLEKCEDDRRDAFRARWLDSQHQRQAAKLLPRLKVLDVLRPGRYPPDWSRLARALIEPISEGPWLRLDGISLLLDQLVENCRLHGDQNEALRNALILTRAASAGSPPDRAETRLAILSIITAALKVAGVLGHRSAHRRIWAELKELHKSYPADEHVRRVLLAAEAIEKSHARRRAPKMLREAILLHAQEADLARVHIRDATFARDWPVIYREVRGAVWNLMNLRLDAGFGAALGARSFQHHLQQHLEWQAITEDHLPPGYRLAKNRSLAVETLAYDVRFLAGVLLDRPNRARSLRGGNPEMAIRRIDDMLNSSTTGPYINELTRGHLFGLRAEALLCLYADNSTMTRADEYAACKNAAIRAYEGTGDQANYDFWAARLDGLEQSIGLLRPPSIA
jgi:hypothetical protein